VTAPANAAEPSVVETPTNAAESSVAAATETEAPSNTDAAVAEETPDVQETVVAEQNATVTEAIAAEENATVTEATAGEENAAVAEENATVTEEPSETEITETADDADASTGENPTAEDTAEVEAEEQTEASDATIESAEESEADASSTAVRVKRRAGEFSQAEFTVGDKNSEKTYDSLAEAVNNSNNGEMTIFVKKGGYDNSSVDNNVNFTLDLNCYSVTFSNNLLTGEITMKNGCATFAVDGTCDSAITVTDADAVYFGDGTYSTITVTDTDTVWFGSGTYNGAITVTDAEEVYFGNGTYSTITVTIEDGSLYAVADVSFDGGNYTGDITVSEAAVEFYGGTYTGDITVSNESVLFSSGTYTGNIKLISATTTFKNGTYTNIKVLGSRATFEDGTYTNAVINVFDGDVDISAYEGTNIKQGNYTGSITIRGGDYTQAVITLAGLAQQGYFYGGTFKKTVFNFNVENSGSLFQNVDCGTATINLSNWRYDYYVHLDGGNYGTIVEQDVRENSVMEFHPVVHKGTTIRNLKTTNKDGLMTVCFANENDDSAWSEAWYGFSGTAYFVSMKNQPISLKTDSNYNNGLLNVSVTANNCDAWYAGKTSWDEELILEKSDKLLSEEETYLFTADPDEWESNYNTYFASYYNFSVVDPDKNSDYETYASLADALEALKDSDEKTIYALKYDINDWSLAAGCDEDFTLDLKNQWVGIWNESESVITSNITVISSGDETGSAWIAFFGGTYNGTITVVGNDEGDGAGLENAIFNGSISVTGELEIYKGSVFTGPITITNMSRDGSGFIDGGTFENAEIEFNQCYVLPINGGNFTGAKIKFNECEDVYFNEGDFTGAEITLIDTWAVIEDGDFSKAMIAVVEADDASGLYCFGGIYEGTVFDFNPINNLVAKFYNVDCGTATINIGGTWSSVLFYGGDYGKVVVENSNSRWLFLGKGTTIGNLSAKDKNGNQNDLPINVVTSWRNDDNKKDSSPGSWQNFRLVSEGEDKSFSLKTDSDYNTDGSLTVSVTANDCKGWYLGTQTTDEDTGKCTTEKSALKLCNRSTYTFAAMPKNDYDNQESNSAYYASYADDTNQLELTTSKKSDTTIHLALDRIVPEAYEVTLVGIKYSSNKLIQSDLEDKLTDNKEEDLTKEDYLGADEITKKLLLGGSGTYCEVTKDKGLLGNSATTTVDFKIGQSNSDAYVYALGYAIISDDMTDQTYTIYTGLYALTLNNTAAAAQ
jgi:hypothetical protein